MVNRTHTTKRVSQSPLKTHSKTKIWRKEKHPPPSHKLLVDTKSYPIKVIFIKPNQAQKLIYNQMYMQTESAIRTLTNSHR